MESLNLCFKFHLSNYDPIQSYDNGLYIIKLSVLLAIFNLPGIFYTDLLML